MPSPSHSSANHKNPSRKTCEQIIERILTTELESYGTNRHFKQASDFLVYFESLYPASASLTKQVQRAVSSMQLTKDKDGYLMIHKTKEEYQAEQEFSNLLARASFYGLNDCVPVLLKIPAPYRTHLLYLSETIPALRALYETAFETAEGILFYTKDPEKLLQKLSSYQDTPENN